MLSLPGKTETATMDLLTVMEKPSIDLTKEEHKSVDLVTTESSREKEAAVNEPSTRFVPLCILTCFS